MASSTRWLIPVWQQETTSSTTTSLLDFESEVCWIELGYVSANVLQFPKTRNFTPLCLSSPRCILLGGVGRGQTDGPASHPSVQVGALWLMRDFHLFLPWLLAICHRIISSILSCPGGLTVPRKKYFSLGCITGITTRLHRAKIFGSTHKTHTHTHIKERDF